MEIKNLTYKINERYIFDKTQLTLGKGLYWLKGSSGSGKSTLFYILKGIIKSKEKIDYKISLMTQEILLEENKTVLDNLLLVTNDQNKIKELLHYLSIEDKSSKKVKELSLGEKQKVSFLQTYLNDSDIYLFDEPISNLDKESCFKIKTLLKELSINKCVVFSSHKKLLDTSLIKIKNKKIIQEIKETEIEKGKYKKKNIYLKQLLFPKIIIYTVFIFLVLLIDNFYYVKKEENIYQINKSEIALKDLYTEDYKKINNYQIKGISDVFEGVIINDVLSKKYDLKINNYLQEYKNNQFSFLQIKDVIEDSNILPTVYIFNKEEKDDIEEDFSLFLEEIKQGTDIIKSILVFSIFSCLVVILLSLIEREMKKYMIISILKDISSLKLTLLLESLLTSLTFLFLPKYLFLIPLNLLSFLFFYLYIRKRQLYLLRNYL